MTAIGDGWSIAARAVVTASAGSSTLTGIGNCPRHRDDLRLGQSRLRRSLWPQYYLLRKYIFHLPFKSGRPGSTHHLLAQRKITIDPVPTKIAVSIKSVLKDQYCKNTPAASDKKATGKVIAELSPT